jgi:murein DD-endopeptidase MepM/ murein hydrolase activator NlpD
MIYGDVMKKAIGIFLLFVLFIGTCLFKTSHRVVAEPKVYYQVYLEGEAIGVIESKQALEKYINEKNEDYKEEFGVDTIYSPNGLDVEKILTYAGDVSSIEDIYNKIVDRKPFTISGYQFTLVSTVTEEKENSDLEEKQRTIKIYTTKEETFKDAVENIIEIFVGEEEYKAYMEKTQSKIVTTGTYIDNIYLNDDVTIKTVKIPVNETIYTDAQSLAQYLLFGTVEKQKNYTVKVGDTIETVAFNNKISVQEFLISNPSFTSINALLFPGQEVVIGETFPQVNVVVETSVVEDQTKKYPTNIQYDSNLQKGYTEVKQKGVNGVERVSRKVKTINGTVAYMKPESNIELKAAIPEIVVYGQKVIPNVGITGNWYWPTKSGYRLTSYYGWRSNPFGGGREFHTGLDISGTGYGSPVYASNNGTVIVSARHWSYGEYIVINHNNGYYTLYAHMSKRNKFVGDVVARGETIGLVGQTGSATGPHLHFEVWKGGPPFTGTRLNPQSLKYYY